MIKGVNRQMIEVTHTGSPYFERAFLVVSGTPSEQTLEQLARRVVEQGETYAGLKHQRRRMWLRRTLFGLGCGGGGAVIMWLCQHIAW